MSDASDDAGPTADATADAGATESRAPVPLSPEARRAATAMLDVGARIGPYEVLGVIGAGGMGEVYRARDRALGRDIALKVLRPRLAEGATIGDGLLAREARALAKLTHPNVVAVHAVGESDGRAYIAMEYVVGSSLRAWRPAAARSWREILAVCLAAGDGLVAAHAVGLVHRDVKPENILVGDDGRPRISDFGLARALDDAGHGELAGTPAYMAPEQKRGDATDARADQFALAIVIWEALAGERPQAPVTPPRGGEVPPAIWPPLARALHADASERYPDVATFLAAVRAAARPRRPRWWFAAAAAVVVIGGAGTAYALWPHAAIDPCGRAGQVEEAALADRLVDEVAATAGDDARHRDTMRRVRERLAARRAGFRDAAIASCKAGVSGALDAELLARSRACLAERVAIARALVDDRALARADAASYAVQVASIPGPRACVDPVALATSGVGASPAHVPARVALVSAAIDVSLHDTRAAERGVADAAALVGTGRVPALDAELAVLRGELLVANDRLREGEQALSDAYYAAKAAGEGGLALRAVAAIIHSAAALRYDSAAAEPWIRTALAEAESERARAPAAVAAALVAVADAVRADGDTAAAVEHGESALALLDTDQEPLAVVDAEMTLASALADAGKTADTIAHLERAAALATRELGPTHLRLVPIRIELALAHKEAGELDATRALLDQARAQLDAEQPDTIELARALAAYGAAEGGFDRPRDAEAFYHRARAIYVRVHGTEQHPDVALLDSNLAALYVDRGEVARAIALQRQALAVHEHYFGADHPEVAGTLFNLAAALRIGDQGAEALPVIARAVTIYQRTMPGSSDLVRALSLHAILLRELGRHAEALVPAEAALTAAEDNDDEQIRAMTALAVGAALVELRRDGTRARALLGTARAYYARYPDVFQHYIDEIDALLARRVPS